MKTSEIGRIATLLVLLSLALTACRKTDSEFEWPWYYRPSADFQVNASNPAYNASFVDPYSNISVSFSEPVNFASVQMPGSFSLSQGTGSNAVDMTGNVDVRSEQSGFMLVFSLKSGVTYSKNAIIRLKLTNRITSITSRPLKGETTVVFSTGRIDIAGGIKQDPKHIPDVVKVSGPISHWFCATIKIEFSEDLVMPPSLHAHMNNAELWGIDWNPEPSFDLPLYPQQSDSYYGNNFNSLRVYEYSFADPLYGLMTCPCGYFTMAWDIQIDVDYARDFDDQTLENKTNVKKFNAENFYSISAECMRNAP